MTCKYYTLPNIQNVAQLVFTCTVPIQYPGPASQLPFNQSSSGSKPGSLSGSKGIRLGLSSVRSVHSERDDADMSTARSSRALRAQVETSHMSTAPSSRALTAQVETSRRALKRAQTKKKQKRNIKQFPIVYQIGPNWKNPTSQLGGFHPRTVIDD